MNKIFFISAIFFLLTFSAVAQSGGTIRGTVTSVANGQPLAGASIQIAPTRAAVETDDAGVFQLTSLPPGRYTVSIHVEGFSDQVRTVNLTAGETATVDFAMSLAALREEVNVTATGEEESVFDSFQSVNSVGGTRITEQVSTAIGEVLERESGVGKRAFGPGTSRPVIRGFDGDRVLVLQDGARTGSAASQSGDHGEPIESMNLERLEVIKGPATLLYGSNAIGGVVNAVSSDENDPHPGVRGYFTGLGSTNTRQGGVAGGVEYGFKKFLWNTSGSFLREGDYRSAFGVIPNSASRAYGGGTTFGYYGRKGFISSSFNLDRRRYGTPYSPLFEDGSLLVDEDGNPCEGGGKEGKGEECQYDIFAIRDRFSSTLPGEPEEAIDIKMRRNTYRARGGFRDVGGAVPQGNFSFSYTKYRHDEIETADGVDEVATSFFNDTFSYRAAFQHANAGPLSGRFGVEGYRRKYLTVGAEQLIDGQVRQNNFAVFGLEELSFERVSFQFGARVETNRYDPENRALYIPRDFTGLSAAAAARIPLWEGASFVANLTTSYRAPALEELYNEGPHIGTVTFEVGDQNLRRERSTGIEFSLRQRVAKVRFNGSFFHYRIGDFIFLEPQDADGDGRVDVEDNLPIGNFVQQDARFTGADLTADADVRSWMNVFVAADIVKAELRDGTPLPRITPGRVRFGVDLRYKGFSVRPEAVFVRPRRLGDVFSLETPTAGYGMFNLNASYTYATGRTAHIFTFGSTNLGSRLYRNHLSFIKDLAPEPGRIVRFSYTVRLL